MFEEATDGRTDDRMPRWPSRNTVLRAGTLAAALVAGCGRSATSPSPTSLSVGQWNGTTAQGAPIAFTVASDETLTAIVVGYSFNGCSGTQMFSSLNVPTAPTVICIPGPCSETIASYRAFSYSSGAFGAEPVTSLNGLFLPGNRAQGLVSFRDYPGCGSVAGVEWTATRR